ncbi:hypothetical protein PVAG01_06923 [Phlyctema vagabunda]|uniref:Extracellular serine-rich protein n=1 Tax=Phlyctema vagabunda TaxID=108571 RepID=A0ABR4PIF0_9HELO
MVNILCVLFPLLIGCPKPTTTTSSSSVKTTSTSTSSVKSTSATSSVKTTGASSLVSSIASSLTGTALKTSSTSKLSSSTILSGSASSSSSSSIVVNATVNAISSEVLPTGNQGPTVAAAPPVATVATVLDGNTVNLNTSTATNSTIALNSTANIIATSVSSTVLVIARSNATAYSGYSGLRAYRIPYQVLVVPQEGAILPALNSSLKVGNFGAIVILSEVSYDYGTAGFRSALTSDQWLQLYTYQLAFGVRMVRIDVYPSADSGTEAQGGCCGAGIDQTVSISDTSNFPTAGLVKGALMSTTGLYHYPANIINTTLATEFAQFGIATGYPQVSTAGVINNIAGREQMVFFTSSATDWSETSNLLMHAWIHWATRGVYTGFRRVYFGTQVDDMMLRSGTYGSDAVFRVRPGDMSNIRDWQVTLNKKLPGGSNYFMEIGYNGNGNIENSTYTDDAGSAACGQGPIEYDSQANTALEFQKPLGTGDDIWVTASKTYPFTTACTGRDPLLQWFSDPNNLNAFAHLSHTFSHESQNNATFNDINYEISWNQAWMKQVGITGAQRFSPKALIPPAITGLHNGDALRAWSVNGLTNCVGDNTRPVLANPDNEHWPLITSVANNGFDGMIVIPRFASRIYYNCDTMNCTVSEWIDTSAGVGDINTLLNLERQGSARQLLALRHDAYMFHQANLRNLDVDSVTINGVTSQLSLIQMWTETVAQEMIRVVNWPLISLKQDDLSAAFMSRMAADQCGVKMTYNMDPIAQTVNGVTVSTTGNTCSVPIPVTVPGTVTSTQGFQTEQLGNDPLTIWVKMAGSPVSFTLSSPVPW